ncbi:hypothetical protein JJB07_11255 [Tumebacillus sp. ITR2]|uniref:Ribbon-helix-helix protein CopG domain-containing protein n=1 Tax=Tumebacillus amylolyticus TaxID=2801339 RepID=A0ABS1JAC3_9BACL|nr:hypothetical protein [Tumebacillus amylolyticus]MBL0387227.1 hypothetical protein [Tumebacillus amylolyticus]
MGDLIRKKRVSKAPMKKNRQAIVIDGDLRRMIRSEARKLNMSEEDYLRLAVHFSEAIRTAAVPAGLLDGGFLTGILGNPMIMSMIKGMIGNAVTKYFNKDSSSPSQQSAVQQVPQHGMGMMPRPPMYGGPHGGPQGMPRPGMQGMHGPTQHGMMMPGMPGMGHAPQAQAQAPAQDKGSDFSMDGIAKMMMNMFGNSK